MMDTRAVLPAVIAHQGGWDEILLFFGLPIALFVVLRYFGIRRERREAAEGKTDEEQD
jgi:hypothetical protein